MKKVLLLTLGILMCSSLAFGQGPPGFIGLYIDPGSYIDCYCDDSVPGQLRTVFVVHKNHPGATGSQFIVVPGPGWLKSGIAENYFFQVIGTFRTGIGVAYGACIPADVCLGNILYFSSGASPPCARLDVLPDPASLTGTIEIADCSVPFPQKLIGQGAPMFVDGDRASCPCIFPLAVEDTSWGKIKSLYQ